MEPTSPTNNLHRKLLERSGTAMAVFTTIAISIGALVEIVPMLTADGYADRVRGVTPYTALEVAGRDIYVREGCYTCHSQMVRPFRAETLRYGPWTRAGEYAYDRPFQLGSRRIGPDLQRIGGKYPDAWHYQHMVDPASVSPGSVMPPYPWLVDAKVDPTDIQASMWAQSVAGTPYTDDDIAEAPAEMKAQGEAVVARLVEGGAEAAADDEIVALIAYLQRLGQDGRAAIAAEEGAK